jgi:cobalt-zinc-cadmium resistance protein CzcA
MKKTIILFISFFFFTVFSTASPSENNYSNPGGHILLSLDSALQLGLYNNPEIKSYSAKIRASQGRLWNSISPPPPEVSAVFEDVPKNQSIKNYGERSFEVSQAIDFPTNYFLRGSKYSKEMQIAKQENAQVTLEVLSNIKSSYFKALALQSQLKIAEENLEIADQFLKKAEIRLKVGEGTNLEKLTARVQYTEARNNLEIQKSHLSTALTELNYAMGNGKPINQEYKLTDSLVFTPLELNTESLIEKASQYNPSLKASKLRLDVSSVDKSLAYSSLFPNFNIGAYKKNITGDTQKYYGVSFGLAIPLWFMFDQNGKIKEASSNYIAADADLHRDENNVRMQIRSAINEYNDANRQVSSYMNEILPQAEEVYRSATKRYESGEITYLEFLEAKQTIINARSNYVDALLTYNLSIITLEQVAGTTIN